ncbi:hypothetical protein LPJ53_004261 [Coemansia erecta]|uniref:Metallo-beta-lactamase domain-containing protein n=1 Tax=Coemansia erecta TaxID=147472 RepID=A0A9W7XUN7_9FUNG|nr:hypothetical protein LPJ53_004261 [Coemansia erecta]
MQRSTTMSSRAFGIGLGWLKTTRGSMPIYCMGAIASVTAYYLISDQWIDSRRRLFIQKRKTQQQQQQDVASVQSDSRFSSLMIGGRFVNPFETWRDKTLWDFLRWVATRKTGNGLPRDKAKLIQDLPLALPHYELLNAFSHPTKVRQTPTSSSSSQESLAENSESPLCYAEYPAVESLDRLATMTATWLGQSTCFVQMEGLNILTDPIFKRRTVYSWLGPERLRPVPCQLEDLPVPDVVLVSHNHFDHLDIDVVRKLGDSVTWYVPLGLGSWFARQGVSNVREMDWWQENELTVRDRTFSIVATPTQHWSGRNGLDSNCTLWSSFLVKGKESSVFHCGDTGYCPAFEEIGRRYGPVDLAILPIGSYEPRWYMCHQHVNPDDAVLIHRDLGARRSIGVHWGTFMMSDEHYMAPPRDLAAASEKRGLAADEFIAPQFGKTYLYGPAMTGSSASE